MTVLDKFKKQIVFPSATSDSDNDLQLSIGNTSDLDSSHEEPSPNTSSYNPPRFKPPKVAKLDDSPVFMKHGGKRRWRRYQNRAILQTLAEEDYEGGGSAVFESRKTPLSKLIEDPNALKYWNEFIDKSEEEQRRIVENLRLESKHETLDNHKTEKPYARISSKIRRSLKIKKNLSIDTVKLFEVEVVHFFKQSPQEKFVKYTNTSFDRLLTHAVAQYHSLHSFSDWENEKRKVEIRNLKKDWLPAECFLHELISQSQR